MRENIPELMATLRSTFIEHPIYRRLREEFNRIYQKALAEQHTGHRRDGQALVLIGASGCGKSTAINRLLSDLPENGEERDCVSFITPSPATLKMVGHNLLIEMGYPITANKASWLIWDQVRNQLDLQKVKFLHFDEAQHMCSSASPRENQNVVNTLKSLMQTRDAQVNLILSGTPELKTLVRSDVQLSRRCRPIEFQKLDPTVCLAEVWGMMQNYCKMSDIQIQADLLEQEFVRRLLAAADHEFGFTIELVLDSIEEALRRREEQLGYEHFGQAFERRTDADRRENPFYALDFHNKSVRDWMTGSAHQ